MKTTLELEFKLELALKQINQLKEENKSLQGLLKAKEDQLNMYRQNELFKEELEAIREREKIAEILNFPIEYLSDCFRSYIMIETLKANRINKLYDIVSLKEEDLLKFNGIGKGTIKNINNYLYRHGLCFTMDISKFQELGYLD